MNNGEGGVGCCWLKKNGLSSGEQFTVVVILIDLEESN